MAGLYSVLNCWQSPEEPIIPHLVSLLLKQLQLSNSMAAKKTAKSSPESSSKPAESPPKPAAKKAATVAKKAVAKKAAASPAPAAKKAAAKKVAAKPSLDAVARAAYLNYRRRVEQGLPGDSHGDWLEAERQFSEPS
jgi:hypothetical protein